MQAETSVLSIPFLDFECVHSSNCGKFTTVEGMLTDVKTQLQKSNPFVGDSAADSKFKGFLKELTEVSNEKLYNCVITIKIHSSLCRRFGTQFIPNFQTSQ